MTADNIKATLTPVMPTLPDPVLEHSSPHQVTNLNLISSPPSTFSATTANDLRGGNDNMIGDYVLGETIGKGTFGKVKLGLHLLTGEKVAVKVLEKKRIVQPADVERVAREIEILKRNRHPNVIQLYEVIDLPECIYLIMEHIDSGEMFEYIVAHRRLREHEAAFLFRQILDGLVYLHQNEVTHRDLKPENLLLQSYCHHPSTLLVKIVDFGLSNLHDGGRLLRTACGSPCYAAPEMIQGRMYHGPTADTWSLGVVLFAMVCGFLPFEDRNTNQLYKKILSANYTMPTFLSANAQDLIRHILETDPEKRFTLDKIRQHPWLAGVQTLDLSTLKMNEKRNDQHGLVLDQLEAIGLSRHEVQTSLSNHAFNRFTASYYLVESKLRRTKPALTSNNIQVEVSTTMPERRVCNGHELQQKPKAGDTDKEIGTTNPPIASIVSQDGQPSARSRSMTHPQPHCPPSHPRGTISPSYGVSQSGLVQASHQRPASGRGGRNLLLLNNGPTLSFAAGIVPVAPTAVRKPGTLVMRKQPEGTGRVTISNGLVTLRPLVRPAQPPKHEFPTSFAAVHRRLTEKLYHTGPPRHTIDDSTRNVAVELPSQSVFTSANGSVVLRRPPQDPAFPSPAIPTRRPHPSFVRATSTTTSTLISSVAKADDTRLPQRLTQRLSVVK